MSIRISDQGNNDIGKPLDLFFLKSVTHFQSIFKTPNEKHDTSLHQQPLLLNNTDIISDDEDHIYTRTQKDSTLSIPDTTIATENCSTSTTPKLDTLSTNAIETQHRIKLSTHCSQSRDPNNKTKPAFKKFCSYCHRTNHSISSCFKNTETMMIKNKPMRDQNLH